VPGYARKSIIWMNHSQGTQSKNKASAGKLSAQGQSPKLDAHQGLEIAS
jgi:hypothetical protein